LGLLDPLTFDGIETSAGNIESADQADVLVAWSAIGQHKDLINPANFLSLVGAVANGGIRPNMHLVETIKTNGTTTYQAQTGEAGQMISPEVSKRLGELMRYNVTNYYGDEKFAGFSVCAKSGTAEVGGDKKPNAMFTGFVTDEELPIAFMITIENGGYGR
jgi:peptidoglycan glycosyltransferase